jgi:hypothetical protein
MVGRIKILVCYYQPWELPQDDIFFPIQAGKACSGFDLGIQADDSGDNISNKNDTFGEFTAWYWAWKNIKNHFPNLEYIGLSHYRRFFCMDNAWGAETIYTQNIPSMRDYENLFIKSLKNNDIILAKQGIFGYDLRTHYSYYHNSFDYLCMKEIVHEICPEYDESFLHIFERNDKMSSYCMFVAKYDFFVNYFEWLFPLLFEAEQRIDVSKYSKYQKRVLAFLAERLLNVYVYHNKLRINHRPIYFVCNNNYPGGNPLKKVIVTRIKKNVKILMPYGIVKLMEKQKQKTVGTAPNHA